MHSILREAPIKDRSVKVWSIKRSPLVPENVKRYTQLKIPKDHPPQVVTRKSYFFVVGMPFQNKDILI